MNPQEHKFELTINLNVLEHLGINLYSNAPSVLSEIVANSWDADASEVRIHWERESQRIVIQDDGIGMTPDEVNKRFLNVGYQRRDEQPGMTEKGRNPMGRKGIGKLSLFSIAKIVQVETAKGGDKSAFCMRLDEIRRKIQENDGEGESGTYEPEILSTDDIDFSHGTRITLEDLRWRQTILTPRALKKRVARRFSIIGEKYGFKVFINDEEVLPSDRDYYNKIQYIWTYGDGVWENIKDACPNVHVENREDRTSMVKNNNIEINGWLATVEKSGDLKDENKDNLNRIPIFVRGKMAQEDILSDFSERGVYASYLIGELRVDDLDQYNGPRTRRDEDAATSSRQRIAEHDSRYRELRDIIGNELKYIQSRWSELRIDSGAQKALEIPEVKDWINELNPTTRKKAQKWLGNINKIKIDEIDKKKQLIKHAVLAFEFYRANENLEKLDFISDDNLQATLEIFGELDILEVNLYGLIVRHRINIIRTLQEKIDKNDLEKAIQEYLFDHLWLLDSSLERPEADTLMETRMDKLFVGVDEDLNSEEKAGRLDIKYRKNTGKHVIIELKRPEVTINIGTVINRQIKKYYTGLRKLLENQNIYNEPIEIILMLGKYPIEWNDGIEKETAIKQLESINARIVFYDQLLTEAYKIYKDYLDKRRSVVDRLAKVMQAIDDYAP